MQSFFHHKNSDTHIICIELHSLSISKQQLIQALINNQFKKKQEYNRRYFINIILLIQYLCKQNILIQSKISEQSNLNQLMKLCNQLYSVSCELLSEYTSWKMQDEIIKLIASDMKERNMHKIRLNRFFGVSADKAADK